MSFELINLTLPLVIQEIEDVLDEYPEHPYQSAFSIHEFRQKLIAYVLSQVPNQYAISGEQAPARKPSPRHSSLVAERMYLETIVRGGILHILRENADQLTDAFLQKKHLGPAISH
jgi:ribosomal protein S18 acetylase RimI-like enzyme